MCSSTCSGLPVGVTEEERGERESSGIETRLLSAHNRERSMIKSQRSQRHTHSAMVGVTSKRILQMTLRKSVFLNRLETFETFPKVSRSVKRFGNGDHFALALSVAHFVLQHPVLSHFLSAACECNDEGLFVTSPPCHTMTECTW